MSKHNIKVVRPANLLEEMSFIFTVSRSDLESGDRSSSLFLTSNTIKTQFNVVKDDLKKSGLIKQVKYSKLSLTSNLPNPDEYQDFSNFKDSFEEQNKISPNPAIYISTQFLQDTSMTTEELDRYEKTIKRKKQIILAGSPGTGKTFIAQKFAKYLTSAQDGYVDLVQFHPSYTYEDFMRGLKPEIKDGNLTYNYAEGRFIQFCEKAQTEYK